MNLNKYIIIQPGSETYAKAVDKYHRGQLWQAVAREYGHRHIVDGTQRCVIKLNDVWWVAPAFSEDDQDVPDIGPFDSMEDAFVFLHLSEQRG